MSIFDPRLNMKPYEYPQLLKFKDAIRQSYWVHEEFETEFISDIQDYKSNLSPNERRVVQRTMLAISQIEISVKEFWGDIFKHCPKPEIGAVGYTFADSEVRHADAYSHLLEILGLNKKFESLVEVGAISDRIKYLSKYKTGPNSSNQNYTKSLLLFSIFVEHVSLFSQFLILLSFNRKTNRLKGIANAVEATSKEEAIHGEFGLALIDIIKTEFPEWFNDEFYNNINRFVNKAYTAENKILDWIFEKGELEFLPRVEIDEFLKNRFNNSLVRIESEPIFKVDKSVLSATNWFDEEILSSAHVDFFHKRPTSYSKNNKSFTEKDLF